MGQKLVEEFGNIVETIHNEDFKKAVYGLLEESPDYIVVTPSSSSGKYHPQDEIGEKGMIRHIRRCAIMADETVKMYDWGNYEFDVLTAAAVLHDIYKQGPATDQLDKNGVALPKVRHTTKYHPTYIFRRIVTIADAWPSEEEAAQMLFDLAHVCLFHEGRWTIDESRDLTIKSKFTKKTWELCKAMHVIDYVVSRRSLADAMQYIRPQELAAILKTKFAGLKEVEQTEIDQVITGAFKL